MKRLLNISLIILVVSILSLTGCNGKEEVFQGYELPPEREEGTKVELVVHETYTDEEHEVFQNIVNMFNEQNEDITVRVERVTPGAQWSRLTQALATGETPDIARVDMEYIGTLADRKAVLPLELLWADGHKEELVEGAISSNTYNKRTWGVPDQIYTSTLFYNINLLDQAGADFPDSSWTYEDLTEVGKKITDRTPEIKGFSFTSSLRELTPIIGSYGGSIYHRESGKIQLDSDEVVRALNILYSYQLDVDGLVEDNESAFINGDTAMTILKSNSLPRILDSGIRFGVTKVPQGTQGNISNINGTSMVIFKNTHHPREAYEFLKFLTSQEIQALWATELGQIPVNKNSFQDVDLKEHPYLEVFMDQIDTVMSIPAMANYSKVEELFNTEIYKVFTGEKRLEHVLMDITAELNEDPIEE